MTGVFRSCLPRFYSNTDQSISNEHLSNKINSFDNENSMECLSVISSNENITTTIPQFNSSSSSSYKEKQISRTKKRGPRYSRINEKSRPLLTRLIGTIFGNYGISSTNNTKKQRSKKTLLPSKSIIKKQFEENEQILHSLLTLLTRIESNVKLTPSTIEKEQARNNNQIDDTLSSNTSYHKSKISKHYAKNRQSKNSIQQKMVDNQQQTQLYPTKINIGTSTPQFNDIITSESSWLDIMREDQTTINAWSRIRHKLKPNQQKDILRALMIICANLFEIPLENKHI